jgi:HTH-type transcriptional regulator / antitoxin HipB
LTNIDDKISNMTDISKITKSLIQARKTKGVSQKVLAEKLGMKQSQISDLERGKHDVRWSTLIEVSRSLGLEIILVPRSLLPAISYITETNSPSRPGKQQSMYESWAEDEDAEQDD